MSPSSKDAYKGINSYQSFGSGNHLEDASASNNNNNVTSVNRTKRSESQSQAQSFGTPSPTSSSGLQQSGSQHEDKDPFTSPGTKKPEQKLSATASAFQPFMFRMGTQGSPQSPANLIQQSSLPSTPFTGYSQSNSLVSPYPVNATPVKVSNSHTGAFSTDTRVTRALRISGIYVPATREQVENCLKVSLTYFVPNPLRNVTQTISHSYIYITLSDTFQDKTVPDKATRRFYQVGNEVLVRFSDVQDAVVIYNYAKASHPEWAVDYISPTVCAEVGNSFR